MSKPVPEITADLAEWLSQQRIFFVATAPSGEGGHINCSPKGGDTFRVLGLHEVAYLDFTGSGAETIAHLKNNGRIVLMFCAFDGAPRIVRLHGQGEVLELGDSRFAEMVASFPEHVGARCIIRVAVERVSTSCGYAVPLFEFCGQRDALHKWALGKGPDGLREYRRAKNERSIDGLPALNPEHSSQR